MKPEMILWVYVAFLVLGGLIGFIKAKSKASIIASVAFAIPLGLCAAGILRPSWIADIILAFLVMFFGMRFAKSKKMMPAGMMAILSLIAIIARVLVTKL